MPGELFAFEDRRRSSEPLRLSVHRRQPGAAAAAGVGLLGMSAAAPQPGRPRVLRALWVSRAEPATAWERLRDEAWGRGRGGAGGRAHHGQAPSLPGDAGQRPVPGMPQVPVTRRGRAWPQAQQAHVWRVRPRLLLRAQRPAPWPVLPTVREECTHGTEGPRH